MIRIGLFLATTLLGVGLGLALTKTPPVTLVLDGRAYEVTPGERAQLSEILRIRENRLAAAETSLLTP